MAGHSGQEPKEDDNCNRKPSDCAIGSDLNASLKRFFGLHPRLYLDSKITKQGASISGDNFTLPSSWS